MRYLQVGSVFGGKDTHFATLAGPVLPLKVWWVRKKNHNKPLHCGAGQTPSPAGLAAGSLQTGATLPL